MIAALIAVSLPAVFISSANAVFGGRIGGTAGYVVTGTTNTLTSGTATVTLKYLRKAGDYTDWKAWVWCNSGTGSWGTGVKQGATAASGSCTNGAWVNLDSSHDSWGAQTTFTVASVTNLVSLGVIVYSRAGDGDITGNKDSQSGADRYFNVNGASTTAWLSDDGKDIFDGDPKPGYATYNYGSTNTSKFRIHYNRADNNYTGYYANLGFEQGSNGNYSYRNQANKASYLFQKAINFNGATTSTYGTYSTGRDAFGPYVDFTPSTTWYTGGFTYMMVCISTSSTDALGVDGCATGDGGYRWLAPTFNTPGTQDLYIQSGTGIGNSNPYTRPTVTAVSPTPLNVSTVGGTTVTLTGTTFTPVPNATPLVYIDGTVSVGTGTDSDSIATPAATVTPNAAFTGTSLTFIAPTLSAGSHTIYVGTAAGFSTGVAFTASAPIPAPSIASLTPASGLRGSTVAIAGTGLDSISSVTVGGVAASIAPSPNATSASFTVPQGATSGVSSVVVTNGGGTATTSFTVLDAPTVSGVNPTSGLRGTSITLTGTFLTGATVTVGGATASPDASSATSITFKIPNSASSGLQSVTVTTAGGSASTNLTVLDVPAITSLSTNSAVRGAPLTINGTGLQNATAVTVGGIVATISSNTTTAIQITVPASASPGPADIVVTSAGGTSNTQPFTVTADAPSIANVSPTSVPQGGSLTITGTALAGATVTIDGKSATVSAGASDSSLTVTVPSNATVGTQSVVLTTLNGTDSSKSVMITAGVPTITSASPSTAPRNTAITIKGSYFTDASSVTIGGTALLTFTVVNSTTITGTVPSSAPLGAQDIVVTAPGGTATGNITLIDVPTVTALSATSGKRGDVTTISGTSFAAVSAITIGGVAITTYTVNSLTSITATIPNGALAGAQSITVTTSAGTSNSDQKFTVFDAPVITSLSPSSGLLGASVTINGLNLKPTASDPTITVGGQSATVTSSSSTVVVFTIPNGLAKNTAAAVVVTNAGGTSNSDKTFTPVDAPTLTSASPSSAGRGATVALTGTNLSNASSVTVNGASTTIASSPAPNATSLTVTVPNAASSGLGSIVVTTPGGSSNALPFTVLEVPTITSLSAISRARGEQVTVTGTYLKNATFTIGGATATPVTSPSASDTSVTITVPSTAAFGATNVVATSTDGSASSPLTVVGYYGTAALKIHYHRSDFDFAKTYIHAWLGSVGAGTVSGASVGSTPGAQSPETLVTADGVDSYGGVATITVSGAADVQQICFLVWVNTTGNTFVKDTGSTPAGAYTGDRCHSLTSATSDEIWLRNGSRTVSTTDPYAGISPSPNASATQTVTIHYDGDTAMYPNVYVGTRSDLNTAPTASPYGYWVDARFYSFISPTTTTGTAGTYTSTVGSDYFGKYVTFTLPYNASHTTRMNMIVTSGDNWSASPPPTKDGGSKSAGAEGNRYLNLDASGITHIYLKAGDSTGDAAFAANPYASPAISSLDKLIGKTGDTVTITGTALVANANLPTVTVGGIAATVLTSPSPNASTVAFTIPAGLTPNVSAQVQLTNAGGLSNTTQSFTLIGPPSVNSPSPATGLRGTSVTISGTGLSNVTDVSIGSAKATVTANDSTSVVFTIPNDALSGTQTVAVTTAGGTSTTSFKVLDVPAITSLSSNTAIRGASLTINGTGLQEATSVTVGGLSATMTSNTATAIGITVPMSASPGSAVIVVTSAGGASNSQAFAVLPDPPAVTTINPSAGPRSSTITITGTNFTGLTGVTIGGASAVIATSPSPAPNDTGISVVVPDGATSGPVDVVVTTASGSYTAVKGFTIVDAPIISSPSPTQGPRGTSVTISGSYLTGATAVTFGGVAAKTYTVVNASTITAVVPDTVTSGPADIIVITPGGTASAAGAFKVFDKPIITSLSQSAGPRGLVLTISGSYLSNISAITIGSVAATDISDNSSNAVSVTVPNEVLTGTQDVSVTTAGGTTSLQNGFTVVDAPTFSGIAPSAGGRGAIVTITGTNFLGATAVKFGGVTSTSFTVSNATSISATVPALASSGNVNVAVTTQGGTVTATNSFFVVDSPVITTLSVNKALRGAEVVITGTALDNPSTVKVGNVMADVLATPGPTSTEFTIVVPQTALSGSNEIVVTTIAGNSNSYPFTVLDTPVLSALSKSVGKHGDVITVTGQYLTGASFTIGDAVATPASSPAPSDTSVTLIVPEGATYGAGAVVAVTDGGIASKSYMVLSPPVITSLSASQGHVGDLVTITGQNFDYLTTVTVNGVTATVEVSPSAAPSDTAVTIEIPATTTGVISVTTLGGSATSDPFEVLINPATISEVSPLQVRRGDTVTLQGTNLYGTTVIFGLTSVVSTAQKDGKSLTFVVPNDANLGTVNIVVKTADDQATNPVSVKVLAQAPIITSLSNSEAHRGDLITAVGENLTGTTGTFADVAVEVSVGQDGKSLTFTVPLNAKLGSNSFVVTTSDDQSTSAQQVSVLADVPTLTSVTSSEVHRGDKITVSGANLSDVAIYVGEWATNFVSPSPDATTISFVIPDGVDAGLAEITAVTVDEQISNPITVNVLEDAPVLNSAMPTQIYRGTEVTISGIYLSGTSFTFADESVDATVNSGGTTATFTVSMDTALGTHEFVATTSDQQSASISLEVLPTPPTLTSLSISRATRGAVVVLRGTGFADATAVNFGAVSVTHFSAKTATSITVTVPATVSVGLVQVTVTTPAGVTVGKSLTVIASPPTITKFVQTANTKRGVGTVTVTGTNLLGATVKVGTLTAVVRPGTTSTKLVFVLPAKALATKTGQFTITTPGGLTKSVKTLKITIK